MLHDYDNQRNETADYRHGPRPGTSRHGRRSVEILDELGYELTADERTMIARHHDRTLTPAMCPFRSPFKRADCNSAYTWNLAKGFIH